MESLEKEHCRMWLRERRGRPFVFWNLLLKGRA